MATAHAPTLAGTADLGRRSLSAAVMGTTAHLVVDGAAAPPVEELLARIELLEASWSRFRPDSELSRLSAADGCPTLVSHPTAMLLERAVWAWERTAGRFDPTVLHAVRAAGYDRDFGLVRRAHHRGDESSAPAPGCEGVEVDATVGLVRLPAGVGIDPGGIGKGLAADLVATAAVDDGARAAMVSLGGDLRVAGQPPADGWEVELDHLVAPPARVNLLDGAVATSSTLRRRWMTDTGPAHHVIDPRTGRPARGPVVACSVVATEAWWAEALATALLVGWGTADADDLGGALDLLGGAGALLTTADGVQLAVGPEAAAFALDPIRPDRRGR